MRLFKANEAIQLVMADVDGTLVTPDKHLTERAKQAVAQLRKAGLKFTLISSRPPYGLQTLAETLAVDYPVVAFNGGMLVTAEKHTLQQYQLSGEITEAVLRQLKTFGLSVRLYTPEWWLIITPQEHPHLEDEIRTIETEPTVVHDFTPYYGQILKITGVSDDYSAVSACQQRIQDTIGSQVSALCSQPYYLDITHKLANKGHAVDLVAEWNQLPSQAIAVIGDMPSDVPMFQQAGLSIAMGNADANVQAQADFVTDTNSDEGFAKAMGNYILSPVRYPVQHPV